jgi:hypothetical protein
MREFQDEKGTTWVASIQERTGDDYKGRYCLRFNESGAAESGGLVVEDVRWNSPRTADRTLATMSVVELRRRLQVARGRAVG